MAIRVTCQHCGKALNAPESATGKKAKCPGCGAIFTISAPETEEVLLSEASPEVKQTSDSTPQMQTASSSLKSMQCQGCGGTVEYQDGQGLFKCKYCGSVYESVSASGGGFSVNTVMVKKLEKIEKYTETTSQIMTEGRLQKKASNVQDKLDYKFIEFDNSIQRKLATAAPIMVLTGIILFIASFTGRRFNVGFMAIGIILPALGALFFVNFKKARAAFQEKLEEMKKKELEPIYDRLRQIGSVMEDGTVSLGYTESTGVPMRYCVCCHKNVTPSKASGSSLAGLTGGNLILTIMTCGLWIPAWFLIEIVARGGKLAGRSFQKGTCPECGNKSLLPARIPNV